MTDDDDKGFDPNGPHTVDGITGSDYEPIGPAPAVDPVFGEIIHAYTRAQAIADGTLVDLRQGDLAALLPAGGIPAAWSFAATASVFAECIALTPAATRACNDIEGRLWDVLFMGRATLHRLVRQLQAGDAPPVEGMFKLYVVRDRVRATPTTLKYVLGPGDDGRPALTVMFPEED